MEYKIIKLIQETKDTKTFRLKPVKGKVFDFKPGHFVILSAELMVNGNLQIIKRAYSISSIPNNGSNNEYIDLTIKELPNGLMSKHVMTLKVGNTMDIAGPYGNFVYEDAMKDAVFTNECILKINDGGKSRELKLEYSKNNVLGISPFVLPVIDSVSPGSPAYAAGLNEGDEILKINGAVVSQFADIGKATITSEGKEMLFEIKREKNKEVITRKVKPMKDAIVTNKYIIGISSKAPLSSYEKVNFFKSLGLAGVQVYSISKLQLVAISKLITGKMSAKDSLGGPVMIVQSAANMA